MLSVIRLAPPCLTAALQASQALDGCHEDGPFDLT